MKNKNAHNTYQIQYYAQDQEHIHPGKSRYVHQHIDRMVQLADLKTSHDILEVGPGLGRFTIPLLERGYKLTCVDISHQMLEQLKANANSPHLKTITADITEAPLEEKYDRIIGFFTLHHMHDIQSCYESIAKIAKPGAIVIFGEPVAYNILYYLQLIFTKNMTWEGEKGIINMRKGHIFKIMKKAGFCDPHCVSYGFFPPAITNTALGGKIEYLLEKARIFKWAHAFQIFMCRKMD